MQTALLLSLVAAAAANPLKFPGSVAELSSRCSHHTVCIGNITGLTACQLSVLLNYIAIAMVCYFDFMILFSKTRGFKIPLFRFGHFSNPDWQPY